VSKYKAKRTEVDGITFASQKEARRYQELKLLERAGEIMNLRLQVPYELQAPRIYVGGIEGLKTPRLPAVLGKYVADFTYHDRRTGYVVEDVKGFKTPLYRWKKKHVEAQYGFQIRET
jgi:hypothetical protein